MAFKRGVAKQEKQQPTTAGGGSPPAGLRESDKMDSLSMLKLTLEAAAGDEHNVEWTDFPGWSKARCSLCGKTGHASEAPMSGAPKVREIEGECIG